MLTHAAAHLWGGPLKVREPEPWEGGGFLTGSAILQHCDKIALIPCFIDVDDCLSNDCTNGATCVDGINQYTCTCPEGFTGKHCESGKEER